MLVRWNLCEFVWGLFLLWDDYDVYRKGDWKYRLFVVCNKVGNVKFGIKNRDKFCYFLWE